MDVYDDLGIRKVINADATLTRLGGSLMPAEVTAAMMAASESFVDLFELQLRAGERIAALTNNEAAYICSGAAAGLYLAALACGLTTNPSDGVTLSGQRRNEIIIFQSQRNPYVPSIELSGAQLVDIGEPTGALTADLAGAISERTVAVFYFAGHHLAPGALQLDEVIAITHSRGVPVVVDAAAQLPPASNLWQFTREMGADLAIFSGGKGLRGPQSSGLVLGRRDLVDVCRAHGAPNQLRGRPMKVGKEEMVGLLAAVERYLKLDFDALTERYEAQVRTILDAVTEFPDVVGTRDWPSEAGQPIPRARVAPATSAGELRRQLWDGDPRIAVAADGDEAILINPETLASGEEVLVAERLVELLSEGGNQG